jgi:hypothetical protein
VEQQTPMDQTQYFLVLLLLAEALAEQAQEMVKQADQVAQLVVLQLQLLDQAQAVKVMQVEHNK